eukprot:9158836-Karenia_brevis.AAC.1
MSWLFLVSWTALGDVLEVSCGMLGMSLLSWGSLGEVLGASWGLLSDFEWSWVVLGAVLGGLGGRLKLLGRLLGRSWTVLEGP